MTRLPSIRRRLSRSLVVISIAWGIAVSVAVWLVVRHNVDDILDHTLQESAEILFGLLSFNQHQLPLTGGELPAPAHEEQLIWQIVGTHDDVLLRSHEAPDRPLRAGRVEGFNSIGGDWRVYSMPFDRSGRVLHVAQRGTERRAAQLEAAGLTVGVALLIGLLCAAWMRSQVRHELEPLSALSTAVARFDPLDVRSMLAEVTRAELLPMHDAINALGARLAKRVASERAFSAHAAHALRTPLAGLVAQLAVAQRELPPEAQPRLRRAREAADRLRSVVTALLTLFRTGSEPKRQAVDVQRLVEQLAFEGLTVVAEKTARVDADPDLLAAALLNLFDNALRHGARQVRVDIGADGDQTRIAVSDDGSGIAEPERLRLQAALDAQSYDEQTGLGLMLADLVARAHGGFVRLLHADHGCTVELLLHGDTLNQRSSPWSFVATTR